MRGLKRIAACAAVVAATWGAPFAGDAQTTPLEGTTPTGWRVVWTDDPRTSATVLWNTAQAGERHVVHFDTESHDGDVEAYAHHHDCDQNAPYVPGMLSLLKGDEPQLFYHRAELTDLTPATTCYFVLESDGVTSPEMHFITAPDDERPVKLIFGGDSRSDHQARCQVNAMMAQLLEEQPEILALAHGGDYIASGTSLSQWRDWMSQHELTTTAAGRVLPIIPARGNHDRGELINAVFGFPPQDRNYYAIDLGPTCRFITLNSETSTTGEQQEWLEQQLQDAQTFRWIVAQYHSPAWPAVKTPSRVLKNWVPLFEQYNVDLVCEADGHNIKRTPPIRNAQFDETGVVYIGEGGLGVKPRTPKIDDRWWLQAPGKAGSGHHVQVLTFTPESLRYEAVLLQGHEIFDEATLLPRDRSEAPRAEAAQ